MIFYTLLIFLSEDTTSCTFYWIFLWHFSRIIPLAKEPELELSVTALNINYGHNKELMEACNTLKDYSLFVSIVRQYIKEIPKNVDDRNDAVSKAISNAIDKCITSGILADFLNKHKVKVQEASMWDYNEELHLKNVKKEGFDEGYDTGYGSGYDTGYDNGYGSGYDNAAIAIYNNLIHSGRSKEEAMKLTGVTEDMLLNSIKS